MSDFDIRYSSLRKAIIEAEFENLNEKQWEAVYKTEGPLLLLAGAGSGKTTVLINRIINLLKYGRGYESESAPEWAGQEELSTLAAALADPDSMQASEITRLCAVEPPNPYEIIAITFTNKAAGELRQRLNIACHGQAADVWAYTFHTACLRILRPDIDKLGYNRNFTIYDEDDKKKLIQSIIKEQGYDEKRFDFRSVAGEISRAKDNLIEPSEYLDSNSADYFKRVVGGFYSEYQKRMKIASALDFDDIIFLTVKLLQGFQDVREYYQNKFRYVLVDEYQDTNHAQYVLCKLLSGKWRNLCVVGDDDQSIYKFRGATIANILDFEKEYKDAVTIRLERNYRSTGNILEAANSVISKNYNRKGKNLWTDIGEGTKVQLFSGETQEDESQYVAKVIKQRNARGEPLRAFTVLYRNHALSNSIEASFRRNTIPYRIVRGLRFLDRAEVRDMLAYLWIICNNEDDVRMLRIINNPPRRIGPKPVSFMQSLSSEKGISISDIIKNVDAYPELSKAAPAIKGFYTKIQDFAEKKESMSLPELYDYVLLHSGYLQMLEEKNTEEAFNRRDNVMELRSTIAEYAMQNPEGTLESFMEEIALVADVDSFDSEADSVTMMTIHSAKGLEFENVFICGMEEGLFPSYRSMEREEEVEEERRLCYVAMTRAKRELHLTNAKRRMLYGQTSFSKQSRFIDEIPEELLEKAVTDVPAYVYGRTAQSSIPDTPRPRPAAEPRKVRETAAAFTGLTFTEAGMPSFSPGDRINHKRFGDGTVSSATPTGGDILLEIQMDNGQKKMFMAKTTAQFIKKI